MDETTPETAPDQGAAAQQTGAPHAPQNVPPYAPQPGGQAGAHGSDGFFDSIRRSGLVRTDERWVGGVAGGLALRFGIDPLVVRGLLAVSVLFGGLGMVLYGLGWLLVPDQRDGRIHLQQLFRGDVDVAVVGGFAVLLSGLAFPNQWDRGMWWAADGSWWQAVLWLSTLALVVVLAVAAASRRAQRPRPPAGTASAAGPSTTLRPGEGPRQAAPPAAWGAPTGPAAPAAATWAAPTGQQPTHPTMEGPSMDDTSSATTATWAAAPTATYPTQASAGYGSPSGPAYGTPASPAYGTPASPAYGAGFGTAPVAGYAPAPAWQAGPAGPTTVLPRDRRRGPGAGAIGIVVGLSLLTLAVLLAAQRTGDFTGPVALTTTAVTITLLGLAIIVSGLRGRTSGGLTGLAILGAFIALPLSAANADGWDAWEGWDGDLGSSTALGDLRATPTDVATAEAGFSLGAGDAHIDLTALPLTGDTVDVPIQMGAGDLTVVVPRGAAYTAEVSIMGGDVTWLGDTTAGLSDANGLTFESPAVLDGAASALDITVRVGAGTVEFVEEGR
ncbi:PspC domain-containing protein [Actinotalea sp.]|uniref:PspC domain-containing protein n=1 Tax=Actinotalea sp. TaxID=1872145 RepID=UPI002C986BD3|nr:PspC domain-containing protein [Actinotalea sp.]HRA50592.1 LiaF-related protein [Actinotalea sp.]